MPLGHEVAPGVAWLRTLMVNVVFVEPDPPDGSWVLVDAGLPGYRRSIESAARERYGSRPPSAIVLTHGHFDHVGSLKSLARQWDVPVYAHRLEMPHLAGRRAYPPPDPTVGGGVMAWSARLYPRAPVDVSTHLRMLPEDGSIPPLPGWRWHHTPGHTDGHVSLWRDSDSLLVSGDAVITVRQEALTAVLTQAPEWHGAPAYFTTHWAEAGRSVRRLADLSPRVLVPGHGQRAGSDVQQGVRDLAGRFEREMPRQGRYVRAPARVRPDGSHDLPPDPWPATFWRVAGSVAAAAALTAVVKNRRGARVAARGRAPGR